MEDNEGCNDFNREIAWIMSEIQGSSAISLAKERPYDAQPHTHNGKRGEQLVSGITVRDIADCMVLGFLAAAGIEREVPIPDDIYNINLDNIDPGAVIQNTVCWIEKYMGIYPNVPELRQDQK